MKRGRNGEWGAACLDLAQLAVRWDILTGTPAPQHPSDFVALLDFLWPEQARRILPAGATSTAPTQGTMHELSHRLQPFFARTRKHELGLMPPDLHVELTQMKPLQAGIYAALRTRMARALRSGGRDQATLARMGAVSMYMVQAASNPGLLATTLGAAAASAVQWPVEPSPLRQTSLTSCGNMEAMRCQRSSTSSERWWRPTQALGSRPSCGQASSTTWPSCAIEFSPHIRPP